jgi:D-glycero-alpha-D-manno-heptose-7-phosphate kinase
MEMCKDVSGIIHPAVRAVMQYLKLSEGFEIHHDGDLPARSGMGSSSSFTVGLLHSLYAHQGLMRSKKQLALESIHIEQNIMKETVGSQDQVCAAFGGLNVINFFTSGEIDVQPMTLHLDRINDLNSHLMLFYTGIKRTASTVAESYVEDINGKQAQLQRIYKMVDQAVDILKDNAPIQEFGELLHEYWIIKKSLSQKVSNSTVDELYERARKAGAIGGKITGAGGGGFLLLFVPPALQPKVKEELRDLINVPFRMDSSGSQIIFYSPEKNDYSYIAVERSKQDITKFRELDTLSVESK